MTRVDITLGLLAIVAAIAITALIGLGEPQRMSTAEVGFHNRRAENGAQMFSQYCANCHGDNAVGGICPPLNEKSGLYGGNVGEGVAWRLEQLGWNREQPYEYIVSTISRGVPVSTRPEQFAGNRDELHPDVMAMPAWSQRYGGPLRDDQVADLATYLTNFSEFIPKDDIEKAKAVVGQPPATARPTRAPSATPLASPGPVVTGVVPAVAPVVAGTATARTP
jgi:mono/diheme cytochrome c family protein